VGVSIAPRRASGWLDGCESERHRLPDQLANSVLMVVGKTPGLVPVKAPQGGVPALRAHHPRGDFAVGPPWPGPVLNLHQMARALAAREHDAGKGRHQHTMA